MRFGIKAFTVFLVIFNLILSQGKEYEGPEDSAGDIAAEKEGYMTGNRVFTETPPRCAPTPRHGH